MPSDSGAPSSAAAGGGDPATRSPLVSTGHPDPRALALERADALLLVVDVQERLAQAMPKGTLAQVEKNIGILLRAASRLGLPVVASEQYRKGLGPTIASVRELLPSSPIEKLEFSCGSSQAISEEIHSCGRRQAVIVGMEAHVCVFQTVRDLLEQDFAVFVPQDAVISRAEENRQIGLRLCEKSGATLTSTETVLFDLLRAAGTPEFKELAPLVR